MASAAPEPRIESDEDEYGVTPALVREVRQALEAGDAARVRTLVEDLYAADLADLLEQLETEERYALAAQEDRSAPRTKVTIPATVRPSGSKRIQTVVHDLSISGFSAAAINRMHIGQLCWLTLPGLESLQAEVVWWDNSIAGCAFAELLSPIVHDNILARYTSGGVFRPIA